MSTFATLDPRPLLVAALLALVASCTIPATVAAPSVAPAVGHPVPTLHVGVPNKAAGKAR